MEACDGSLVGRGHFSADVELPEQTSFPSEGRILAFDGRLAQIAAEAESVTAYRSARFG
jgi:hypothetical protein